MNLNNNNTNRWAQNVPLDAEQRRSALLIDATKEFCAYRGKNLRANSEKYLKLFYALINHTDAPNRKKISSFLARNYYTPRSVAYFLAMESIDIAAPFLLISPVLWERDLLILIDKLSEKHLTIIARRSDVNAKIATALVASGNKTVCSILSNNPVFKLNSLARNPVNKTPKIVDAHIDYSVAVSRPTPTSQDELLSLANTGGRLGRRTDETRIPPAPPIYNNSFEPHQPALSFAERLISIAKEKDFARLAREISELIELPIENVSKLITHESGESLAIFMKGMGISRTYASQLLLLVNKKASRNIAEFTRSMAQFDRFSISQCHDIMKNLGAKPSENLVTKLHQNQNSSPIRDAARERRNQISRSRTPALFGDRRLVG